MITSKKTVSKFQIKYILIKDYEKYYYKRYTSFNFFNVLNCYNSIFWKYFEKESASYTSKLFLKQKI